MLHLAQAYWVTNSFDMNSFNVLFGKWDGLITGMVLRAKRGGPGLCSYNRCRILSICVRSSSNPLVFVHGVKTYMVSHNVFFGINEKTIKQEATVNV